MFINRDGWDNAEKVSKAHVGKEKQLHGKSEELGNDSFQRLLKMLLKSIPKKTYQLCREPWPLWLMGCECDLKRSCGLAGVWTAKGRRLGRQALNRDMCLRMRACLLLAVAAISDQWKQRTGKAASHAGMNLWLGLYWFCYVASYLLPWHDRNTWKEKNKSLSHQVLNFSCHIQQVY